MAPLAGLESTTNGDIPRKFLLFSNNDTDQIVNQQEYCEGEKVVDYDEKDNRFIVTSPRVACSRTSDILPYG